MSKRATLYIIALFCMTVYSCTTVKPYQRAYLNDANMKPGQSGTEQFAESAHSYREGASGGGSGKTSGGCGCN